MQLKYIDNVATLSLDAEKCIGCGMCTAVCPHAVFEMADRKAAITNKNGCIECGACAVNCPADAISVEAGVGCATAMINELRGKGCTCDCC